MALSRFRLRLYRRLHQPKGRREAGLFLVEGPDLIKEALQEGWPLREAVLTSAFSRSRTVGKELIKLLDLAAVTYEICSESDMERISEAKTPQGAVALAQVKAVSLPLADKKPVEVLLVCERVSDPGNLGTLLRTADWFGVGRIILGEGSADPLAPKVVRASAGSIFRVEVEVATDLTSRLKLELGSRRALFAATMSGELLPSSLPKAGLRGLVIGHERRGVSPHIAALCSATVRISGAGRAESLNLAVAAGILLHALCASEEMVN